MHHFLVVSWTFWNIFQIRIWIFFLRCCKRRAPFSRCELNFSNIFQIRLDLNFFLHYSKRCAPFSRCELNFLKYFSNSYLNFFLHYSKRRAPFSRCELNFLKYFSKFVSEFSFIWCMVEYVFFFFQTFPMNTWVDRSDVPLRTIKTVIHTLCKIFGYSILPHLDSIPGSHGSDLHKYITKTLKVSHGQYYTASPLLIIILLILGTLPSIVLSTTIYLYSKKLAGKLSKVGLPTFYHWILCSSL